MQPSVLGRLFSPPNKNRISPVSSVVFTLPGRGRKDRTFLFENFYVRFERYPRYTNRYKASVSPWYDPDSTA